MPTNNILFTGLIASGVTKYIEIPIRDGTLGLQLAWKDTTSSATITLEMTSNRPVSAVAAGSAFDWTDSAVSVSGPTGAGAGASLVNVENIRQRRARLKIVTAAATTIDILDGTAPE